MTTKVAINGLGRIGRAILKLVTDEPSLELVAVNDLIDAENLAYLLRFDTSYGRYAKSVAVNGDNLVVAGRELRTLRNRDPLDLPWMELGVDLVFECTGVVTKRQDLEKHIRAGARIVLLSAPSKSADVETVVRGANAPKGASGIISCASCTTNCITPVMEVLGRRIGVKKAIMTAVHAYTASQAIVDGAHSRPRRGRAGGAILVPTSSKRRRAAIMGLEPYVHPS
jgi:glyceraldehyde 3-phosphate dehydrogenase